MRFESRSKKHRIVVPLAAAWLLVSVGCSEDGPTTHPGAPVGAAGTGTGPMPGAAGTPGGGAPVAGMGSSAAAGSGDVGSAGMPSVPAAGMGGAGAGAAGSAGSAGSAGEMASDAGTMPEDASLADSGMVEPDAGDPVVPRMDLGEGDGSDVIMIGDSWMSNTLLTGNAISGALQRLTGKPYRNYAVQGVMLLQTSLFGPAIPTQYDSAKLRDPDISTVIMTGGGNDIIQNASVQASCDTGGDLCKQKMAEIAAALAELWTEMSNDGVKDVVYIRYAASAGSADDSVRDPGPPPEICVTGPIRCHSLDTTDIVMNDLTDGIHPTRAANDRIAQAVWNLLEEEGIRR